MAECLPYENMEVKLFMPSKHSFDWLKRIWRTKVVLITNHRKINTVKIRVDNHEVVAKSVIRYLMVVMTS